MFTSTSTPTRKKMPKLIAGFAALSITTIVAASGFAAAASPTNKPSKEDCMKAGFPNYGQCVKEWAHHKNHPGNGYGGQGNGGNTNTSITINLNLDHANNNTIQIIIF